VGNEDWSTTRSSSFRLTFGLHGKTHRKTKSTIRSEQLKTNRQRHRKARGGGNDIICADMGGTNVTTLSPKIEVRESHDMLHDFPATPVSTERPTHQHHDYNNKPDKRELPHLAATYQKARSQLGTADSTNSNDRPINELIICTPVAFSISGPKDDTTNKRLNN